VSALEVAKLTLQRLLLQLDPGDFAFLPLFQPVERLLRLRRCRAARFGLPLLRPLGDDFRRRPLRPRWSR